ncbi:MAG: hypothetical protein KAJ98_02585 [Spirochaetaceae bacterium]|nr:hypothetical protein [Spirochaetaceae bacterium]
MHILIGPGERRLGLITILHGGIQDSSALHQFAGRQSHSGDDTESSLEMKRTHVGLRGHVLRGQVAFHIPNCPVQSLYPMTRIMSMILVFTALTRE